MMKMDCISLRLKLFVCSVVDIANCDLCLLKATCYYIKMTPEFNVQFSDEAAPPRIRFEFTRNGWRMCNKCTELDTKVLRQGTEGGLALVCIRCRLLS